MLDMSRCQPAYKSGLEALAVTIHASRCNLLAVVLYRPGSADVTNAFFEDLSDVLERSATYACVFILLSDITAELGRALAVVKVTLQVNGNTQFSRVRVCPSKTIGAIKIKSGTNDYVGEGNPQAKFGNIVITGGFSPYG